MSYKIYVLDICPDCGDELDGDLCKDCKTQWIFGYANKKKGCGILIPVDPSDKNSEGWQCGQYYDSYEKEVFCDKCSSNIENKNGGDK